MAKKRVTPSPDQVPSVQGQHEQGQPEHGQPERTRTPWFRVTVIILFAVVYVWDVFVSLSNFLGALDVIRAKNEVQAANNSNLYDTPWVALIVNLVLPIVVFGLSLFLSRRRSVGILAVFLLAGLGVVAAMSLGLIVYVQGVLSLYPSS